MVSTQQKTLAVLSEPTHERIVKSMSSTGSQAYYTTRTARAPAMSTSEFAHLIGVIKEQEYSRRELIHPGLDLTRHQQQRREGRYEFLDTPVAPNVKNDEVRVGLRLVGCFNGGEGPVLLNSSYTPPVPRTGAGLKEHYFAVQFFLHIPQL